VKGRGLAELVPGRKAEAMERAGRLLADTLARAYFADLTAERIQQALASVRDEGRSAQTANHFRAALRAFLRWCHDRGRIRSVPTDKVEGYNVDEDLRHIRRSLTEDELARLIAHAESGRDRWRMPGPLRAMAYRVAASTGFRAEELRGLTPESFRLDGVRPTIYLKASSTKNRKPADQPVARPVAAMLRRWLEGRPAGRPVFPLHCEMAKAMQADLRAIGVPYETEDGKADFHSLRSYYVTALIRTGRSIKEVQQLARHAKPETTLKYYAKVAAFDLHNAVEALPVPGVGSPALAATGTDHADTIPRPTAAQTGASNRKS
jgi:integrase